ncbi:MAG: DUF72 domain-containing protein [Verrucomicrobiota bacterium]
MRTVYVGTSGWYYKDWHASFYPPKLSKPKLLPFYAERLPTVEINASFYKLLTPKTVEDWSSKVPEPFIFVVKGSRFITHMIKLKNPARALKNFFASLRGFGKHLGPILWQLPPMLHKDIPRLEAFLHALPKHYRFAVEFRHPSWIDDAVLGLLYEHNVAEVWLSSLAMPMRLEVTADFVFTRFHGLEGGFRHDYSRAELEPWAKAMRTQARQGREVFAFFNNDGNARAPQNARMLMEMVEPYAVWPEKAKELLIAA